MFTKNVTSKRMSVVKEDVNRRISYLPPQRAGNLMKISRDITLPNIEEKEGDSNIINHKERISSFRPKSKLGGNH